MATPPSMRQVINWLKLPAQPVSSDETPKRQAEKTSSFLRPNLSLSPPARSEPARQPSSAQLLAHPLKVASVVRPSIRARE